MKLKLLLILILTNSLLFSGNYKKVKIYLGDLHTAEQLNSIGLEIDHAHFNRDNSIDVFLSDSQFNRLQNSFFQYDILIDNWNEYYSKKEKLSKFQKETILTQTADKFGVSGFDFGSMGGFYTLDEVYQKLDELFTNYSDLITEKDSIGHTNENRPIYAVKISDNPNVDEDEPEVLYTALHHAREPESMMQMIYFMYYLLENYGTDDEVTYLMENREFYFIPVVNPDGYKYNEETDPNGGGMWRKNKRDNDEDGVFNPSKDGVDLNRNYGYQWAYDDNGSSEDTSSAIYRGTAPFSEPETETVRQFCIAHDFKLALNYHTYSNLLITPWGYIPEETPDSLFYRDIASDMTQYNNYTWGFSAEIIYAVNGDSDDWFYGEQTEKNKIFAMTPEVGESFWPSEDRIIPLAEENVYPNLYLAWVAGAFVNTSNVVFDKEYYSAGDSGSISMNFKNKGLLDAENISSTMISQSSEIEVTSDVIEILKLNSRQESEFPAAFQFKVSNDAIAGESHILKVETYLDNTLMSVDEIKIIVGQPEVYFTDDASNIDDWIEESDVSKKWELTTSNFYSLPSSFTESKIGNYLSNSTVTLTKSTEIDLLSISKPFLSFYTKFSIEKGWDYGQVLISSDSGNVWTPVGGDYSSSGSGQFQPSGVPVYDGKENNWINEIIDISQYIDNKILLRFQLKSDAYIEEDGWYIDDIKVFEYTNKVVSVNNNSDLPVKFMLSQNYPNPFNPSTTIKYSISSSVIAIPTSREKQSQEIPLVSRQVGNPRNDYAQTTLKVYDILGREVAILINKQQQPGDYEVEFDAKKLTSGVYYYTLRSGDFVESRKMLLLK